MNLLGFNEETEWLEFKENLENEQQIGEYISALSNAASIWDRDYAYLVWGVNDKTKVVVGTKFNHRKTIEKSNEVLEHYLARNLYPSINFRFHQIMYEDKNVIMLEISRAKRVPTSFKGERFIRIDSSKVNIKKYPERESELFDSLKEEITITNKLSTYQKLTFNKLFVYYAAKGITLNKDTFEENLSLKTSDGKYNILAQLLSDDSKIRIRVSTFNGNSKEDKMTAIEDFGNTCLLYSFEDILRYGNVINRIQSSDDGTIPRIDTPYFDHSVFNEVLINAFVHNLWIEENAPQIHVFNNRIEVISHGGLPKNLTIENFFRGVSRPRNISLAEIFLQLHISEKTGRGVPRIVGVYGRDVFEFNQGYLSVTIPFKIIGKHQFKNDVETVLKDQTIKLNHLQKQLIEIMADNASITVEQIILITNKPRSTINYNISILKKSNIVERVGSNKSGYWKIHY